MSIRTKLLLSYIGMILIPLVLFGMSVLLLIAVFFQDIQGAAGVSPGEEGRKWTPALIRDTFAKRDDLLYGFKFVAQYDPGRLTDRDFLSGIDDQLMSMKAGMIVVRQDGILYVSPLLDDTADLLGKLRHVETGPGRFGSHLTGNGRFFAVEKQEFTFPDHTPGTLYMLWDTSEMAQFFRRFFPLVILSLLIVLGLTNGLMTFLVSRSIIKPLFVLKRAAEQIKDGNLDHEVKLKRTDEIGELSQAFEEMRCRLRDSIRLQLQYEENRKELLSNISHDLKTPITAIKGCVEGMSDGVANTPEKREKYIEMIAKKAEEMDRQIDELFLFSKLDLKSLPFHFERLDITAYLRDCAWELRHDPQKQGVAISFEYGGNRPVYVIADREKLDRVISNIIENSMKYMKKEEKEIHIALFPKETEVIVSIRDNGPGIESAALPYIFDRFYRAEQSRNKSTGGSGLGLAIVKQIVEEHGGRVWAESAAGKGTVISFTLPKQTGQAGNGHETDPDH
ncbi:sensor histidine kinase [Brevibacillus sp. B_LB10_24]|uniref:sensor histidine kinase n=1 Tax=Brevibacillus sp. B_LB10_24 TaxID=3380645 RepID=UPI0038B7FF42